MIPWAAIGAWFKGLPDWVWYAVLAAFSIYLVREDARRDERRAHDARARKTGEKVIRKHKEDIDDRMEQARRIGQAVRDRAVDPGTPRSEQLSERTRRLIIRDAAGGGDGGGG